jgi:hypothetical protein
MAELYLVNDIVNVKLGVKFQVTDSKCRGILLQARSHHMIAHFLGINHRFLKLGTPISSHWPFE